MNAPSEVLLSVALAVGLLVPLQGRGRKKSKPQKAGEVDVELPQAAAQETSPPALAHRDRRGLAERTLLELVGTADYGFGALWRDGRDGAGGLYFTRLSPRGALRGPERPLAARGSTRLENAPAIDLDTRGQAVLAWRTPAPKADPGVHVRLVRHDGTFHGAETFIPVPKGRTKGAGDMLGPSAVVGRAGDAFLAFGLGGRVFIQHVDSGGAAGELRLVDSGGHPVEGAPFLLASSTGPELCVWNTAEGIRLRRIERQQGLVERIAGPGRVLEVLPVREDERTTGWWLLVEWGEHLVLRHVNEAGERVGLDQRLLSLPFGHVDLAYWSEGLALLSQPTGELGEEVFEGGPFSVQLYSRDGREALGDPVTLSEGVDGAVRNPQLAAAADHLMVAWSERRPAGTDVHFRVLAAGEAEWGPEKRLSSDRASADQRAPRAASAGGDRAVVAWEDHREGAPGAFARLYASGGEPLTGEFRLPVAVDAPAEDEPEPELVEAWTPQVAMAPEGSFAVVYGRPESVLEVQAFDRKGVPTGPAAVMNRAARLADGFRIGRQERFRAWLVAWAVEEDGIYIRRIRGDGVPLGKAVRVHPEPTASHPALVELGDGRVLVVFEDGPRLGPRRLAGRFLTQELGSGSRVFEFPSPSDNSFRSPQLALGQRDLPGSFLMTWVAGDDGNIAAQLYDGEVTPMSSALLLTTDPGVQSAPALARLPDHSWVVAWEDQATRQSHVYARRIRDEDTELGPVRLLSHVTHGHRISGHAPALVAVDTGLFLAWSDAQRGQGYDVWIRVLGASFDMYAPAGR
jgi:hypothetical protein